MAKDSALISKIKSGIVSNLSWQAARNTNLHIENQVLKKGEVVLAYKQRIAVERDSIMVFADDAPQFNWSHPCRYLLHDAATGDLYNEVSAQFPPYMTADIPKTFQAFHTPIKIAEPEIYYPVLPWLRCPIRWTRGQRYAVLFSGASNNRHTNDLEFLYRTLRDIYGFPAANIFVLNYDGTINYSGNPHPVVSWPGDSTAYRMPVNGKGTKADLDTVFNTLKAKLKPDDLLLIHTNNHGGHNGSQSYLCTYSGADYLASDFADTLATLPKHYCMMVMMEQCHAGGFNAPILAKSTATYTSVSSACLELNNSIGGAQFDPFARDWIAAMAGHTPYGGALASNPDTDGSGKVSAREAHDYADSVHDPYDTPVFSRSSVAAGNCFLGQRYWYLWPVYCRLLVEFLQPYYLRKPIPEFYDMVHAKLVPQLREIESKLENASAAQEKELRATLGEVVKKTLGK
ncbi:MAG: C13 family peptidase [Nitrosomonas sp.]|uniref:C13 family peptidase n=1 Tax=Nitrosomonas sp. TaxID=42353 RepID=UPI0025E1E6D9|nr:C13 family peptidase [Nitrosomonas sp.]UJP04180.1 MAG: C13 family peptidase [Nitrosomonas sp.]